MQPREQGTVILQCRQLYFPLRQPFVFGVLKNGNLSVANGSVIGVVLCTTASQ